MQSLRLSTEPSPDWSEDTALEPRQPGAGPRDDLLRSESVSRAPLLRACCISLCRALPDLLVLTGGYAIYRAISIHAPRQPAIAHAHAAALIDLERHLGLALEGSMQHAALQHGSLAGSGLLSGAAIGHIVAMLYAGSQLYWIAALLFWLYITHRRRFVTIRNILVASTLLVAVFSALYAVAPPRFALAGPPYRVEDLLHPFQSEPSLVRQSILNPYASLPSLHVLWAMVAGLGLYMTATTVRQRLCPRHSLPSWCPP